MKWSTGILLALTALNVVLFSILGEWHAVMGWVCAFFAYVSVWANERLVDLYRDLARMRGGL